MRLPNSRLFSALLLAFFSIFAAPAFSQTPSIQPRITQPVDESKLSTLTGNTHPLARAQFDRGAAPDGLPMQRMLLVLKRSPKQEAALAQLLADQQNQSSPNYHKWLTPQQFGQQFGPADQDIQAVTSWLAAHGFQVAHVSNGRSIVEFSGTAGQMREAFHTVIHKFAVNGEEHWANAGDPQIPMALAPVVAGVASLNNFPRKPLIHKLGIFSRDMATGRVTPEFTFAFMGQTFNALAPADFAKIYTVPNMLLSPPPGTQYNGNGVTIAIIGDSEICTASSPDFGTCSEDDVKEFRSLFGLPTGNLPQVIVDGPDPGFNGDEIEGDLDSEWAGAVAPNATILFVTAEATETTAGIDLAAEHVIDNNLASILNESFGSCELNLGVGGNAFYNALWGQGSAQGISVVVSAGDSGSANCDDPNTELAAQNGLNVNGIASTPFDTAAGGTDFNTSVANYQSTFWSSTNSATDQSAKSYIPEIPWNDSCAALGLTGCTNIALNSPLLNIVAGGGGRSLVYTKPSWQTGPEITGGVSTDGSRDLPDMAIFASDGLISGSFYLICEADLNPGGQACNLNAPFTDFVGVGGTSSAAPTFAGMLALVNQKTGSQQGLANYGLYQLAAAENYANCNSTTGSGPACVFNDVTQGNNSVACVGGTLSCSAANSNQAGVLETANVLDFTAGTGFDLATGLGSINVTNLIAGWPTPASFISTTSTLCLSTSASPPTSCPGPLTITHGTKVFVNGSVMANSGVTTPTGNVALFGTFGGNTVAVDHFDPNTGNTDFYPLTGSGTTATILQTNAFTTEFVGGSYTVSEHYQGDGVHGASNSSPGISVTVNPENSKSTVTLEVVDPFTLQTQTATTEPYGAFILVRTDVVGSTSNLETGTGNVAMKDNGSNFDGGNFPLNSDGYMEVQTPGNFTPTGTSQIPAIPVGAHSFQATYAGDASYNGSASSAVALAITKATTTVGFVPLGVQQPNVSFTLTAIVDTELPLTSAFTSGGSFGNDPTGTVTFKNGNTTLGTVNVTGTTDAVGFSAAQASITTSLSGIPGLRPNSPWSAPHTPRVLLVWLLVCCALLFLLRMPRARRRGYAWLCLPLFVLLVGAAISACGGGGGPQNFTITATYNGDGNYSTSTNQVTITVQ